MNNKGNNSWLKHIDFMLIDVIVLIISFSVSYFAKFNKIAWWKHDNWGSLLIFLCLLDVVITFLVNPYSGILKRSLNENAERGFLLTIYNLASACFVFYLLKVGVLFSREMLFEMYAIYFVSGLIIKFLWKKIVSRNQKKIPLYIVCEGGKENEIMHNSLSEDGSRYDVVGFSNNDGFFPDLIAKKAQEVLIAVEPGVLKKETYAKLIENGIGIHMNIESMIGIQTEDQFITGVGVYKALSIGTYSFTSGKILFLWVKRFFDIVCGLIGLVLLIPISLAVKICYLCTGDMNSIFYTQTRVGHHGKLIKIYKYRSMVPNAEVLLDELLKDEKYREEWKENQKFMHDPRITKVGYFLRETSLDELPQFLNVLKGEMSLVGPRPLVVGELEAHDGLNLYNQVKPGITGWWGCKGRSNINYRERLELEYYYVKHCSFSLDLLCIFKTVLAVLKREGSK